MINYIKLAVKASGSCKSLNYIYLNVSNNLCINYNTPLSPYTCSMKLTQPKTYIRSRL